MRVPEPKQAGPCCHCGGSHPDELCMWQQDDWEPYCKHCGELLHYDLDSVGWCMTHGAVTEQEI